MTPIKSSEYVAQSRAFSSSTSLPLTSVQWRDVNGKRNRPNIDSLREEYGLEDITLTLLRDTRTRKSSFQPRTKGKFTEHWTDEDKVTCNPHSIFSPRTKEGGVFYLTLLGTKYRNCGMTSPYLKYVNPEGRILDVARITVLGQSFILDALPDSDTLSNDDYTLMYRFLCKPVERVIGTLTNGTPTCLYPDEYLDFELYDWHNLPKITSDKQRIQVARSIYTLKGESLTYESVHTELVEVFPDNDGETVSELLERPKQYTKRAVKVITTELETLITVPYITPKQYVMDWLRYHPIANNTTLKRDIQAAKQDRNLSKASRHNKYKKGKAKLARIEVR